MVENDLKGFRRFNNSDFQSFSLLRISAAMYVRFQSLQFNSVHLDSVQLPDPFYPP